MEPHPAIVALSQIPPGETRTFAQLAALAGQPGAARLAGRLTAAIPVTDTRPWHRVVRSDGGLARASDRAAVQMARLRQEGARPQAGESTAAWATRIGASVVGYYPTRRIAPAAEAPIRWNPVAVEAFCSADAAARRGFPRSAATPPFPEGPPQARAHTWRPPEDLRERLAAIAQDGWIHLKGLVPAATCRWIRAEATRAGRFSRATNMASRGFGVGAYHFWAEPLPAPLDALRRALYAATRPPALPPDLGEFHQRCREHGQHRGSCILIATGPGGVNHPHRDIYGPIAYPLQSVLMLSERETDFKGGEFQIFVDGDPVYQVPVSQGDLVVFPSQRLPDGRSVRHGMAQVTHGTRYAVGIVFHLAR